LLHPHIHVGLDYSTYSLCSFLGTKTILQISHNLSKYYLLHCLMT